MNAPFPAGKRPVQLDVVPVGHAEALGASPAMSMDAIPTAHLAAEEARRLEQRREAEACAAASAAFIAQNGARGDEFSTLR